MVHGQTEYFWEGTEKRRRHGKGAAEGAVPAGALANFWKSVIATPGAALIKRGLFEDVGRFRKEFNTAADRDFWMRLEYEASEWLRNAEEKALGHFWIDGFVPERITDTQRGADVEGRVWVADDARQDSYRFVVSLPQKLLHGAGQTFLIEEVVLDRERKTMRMVIGS